MHNDDFIVVTNNFMVYNTCVLVVISGVSACQSLLGLTVRQPMCPVHPAPARTEAPVSSPDRQATSAGAQRVRCPYKACLVCQTLPLHAPITGTDYSPHCLLAGLRASPNVSILLLQLATYRVLLSVCTAVCEPGTRVVCWLYYTLCLQYRVLYYPLLLGHKLLMAPKCLYYTLWLGPQGSPKCLYYTLWLGPQGSPKCLYYTLWLGHRVPLSVCTTHCDWATVFP